MAERARRLLLVVNTDFFFLSHRLPLALAAREQGWHVVVATADTGRAEEVRGHGLEHVSLRMTRSETGALGELRSVIELVCLLRRIKPDVVHLVATKSVLYGGLAALTTRQMGVIYAITGSGYLLGDLTSRVLQRLARRVFRLVLHRRRSVTIFQNVEDRAFFVDHGMVRRAQTVLIRGSGVDAEAWSVQQEPEQPVVLLASRLFAEKGVRTFVEAVARIKQAYPAARCVLVGAPADALPTGIDESELRDWVNDGVVEWWGYRSDMPEVLGACSVFVLPTYHREGVPRVLLEAGAAQRSVVTTDIPGCRDVVIDGETGLLVQPKDPEQLAAAVIRLLGDDELRHRLGAALRVRVADQFALADVVRSTLDLYAQLLPAAAATTDGGA